ncbi:RidA family protein [Stappia sediminis]|nr:RidA family protein [Stappia sediminis]
MPIPQGNYVPAQRVGNMVYTSGMTPRQDGELKVTGQIPANANIEEYRFAVELACGNALTAARGQMLEGEFIDQIVSMSVFIAAEAGFTTHAKLADFASNYLFAELGDRGIGARAAIGVATLPGNAPVEIQLTAAVKSGE